MDSLAAFVLTSVSVWSADVSLGPEMATVPARRHRRRHTLTEEGLISGSVS